jgi:8-oxo-dGTP diphosphatase
VSLAAGASASKVERATLLFVQRDHEVLLIHKKRGLGAGKVTAPGGRIEPGESALEAAVRELREEVGVRVDPHEHHVVEVGDLSFQFADGFALRVHVFRSHGGEGEPRESDEAAPFWCPVDALPFYAMWADDEHWLPLLLGGQRFVGRFEFDGDALLSARVERVEHLEQAGAPSNS